ncbi:MAG: hypothetical protein AAF620_00210 [Bacteroidota bacterium]
MKKQQKVQQKRGRPNGSYQRRRFIDTHVGRFIFLHEPLLYTVICPSKKLDYKPEVSLIEWVIGFSDNPSFRTKRYAIYLKEYRKNGLHVTRKKAINPKHVDYYNNLRMRRALSYIRKNKDKIHKDREEVIASIQKFIDELEK